MVFIIIIFLVWSQRTNKKNDSKTNKEKWKLPFWHSLLIFPLSFARQYNVCCRRCYTKRQSQCNKHNLWVEQRTNYLHFLHIWSVLNKSAWHSADISVCTCITDTECLTTPIHMAFVFVALATLQRARRLPFAIAILLRTLFVGISYPLREQNYFSRIY